MAGIEDGDVGFEEAISWLPSHVLYEAVSKECVNKHHQHPHRHRRLPRLPLEPQRSKSSPITNCRAKYASNWASGGPGMQAVFLDSGKKSPGTGVFLPQRAGTNMQSSKKPACSPVLLPARVVQALNLNVHEIGVHLSRGQDVKNKSYSFKNINRTDVSAQCGVISNNKNSSPEMLLPEEWTY